MKSLDVRNFGSFIDELPDRKRIIQAGGKLAGLVIGGQNGIQKPKPWAGFIVSENFDDFIRGKVLEMMEADMNARRTRSFRC